MSAPEQIPYVGYVANGIATEFPITFDLHDIGYLVVTLNKEIPQTNAYTVDLNGMKVVFAQAPKNGDQVELYRDTVIDRDTDYKTYDNSFRPEAVNYDFDKIIHILQEQHMIDAELASRLKQEIEWRRTHDANFDELAKMRDSQIFTGLKGYVDTYIAATNPNIFEGITAGIVFALDKKSVQTHLEIIYQQLSDNRQSVTVETDRALNAEQALRTSLNTEIQRATGVEAGIQTQVNALGGGSGKAYKTYADMIADKANIPSNSIATVTNDSDSTKNGDWQYDGANFTKSAYDPVTLAVNESKNYSDTLENAPYLAFTTSISVDTNGVITLPVFTASKRSEPVKQYSTTFEYTPASTSTIYYLYYKFSTNEILTGTSRRKEDGDLAFIGIAFQGRFASQYAVKYKTDTNVIPKLLNEVINSRLNPNLPYDFIYQWTNQGNADFSPVITVNDVQLSSVGIKYAQKTDAALNNRGAFAQVMMFDRKLRGPLRCSFSFLVHDPSGAFNFGTSGGPIIYCQKLNANGSSVANFLTINAVDFSYTELSANTRLYYRNHNNISLNQTTYPDSYISSFIIGVRVGTDAPNPIYVSGYWFSYTDDLKGYRYPISIADTHYPYYERVSPITILEHYYKNQVSNNTKVNDLTARVGALENSVTVNPVLLNLKKSLSDPFHSVYIRLIGDSITWGVGAANSSPSEPRNHSLSDPRNNLQCKSWANLLRDYLGKRYVNIEAAVTEDAPGSGYYEKEFTVDISDTSLFQYIERTTENAITPVFSNDTTSYFNKTFRLSATNNSNGRLKFKFVGSKFRLMYTAQPATTNNFIDVYANGALVGSFDYSSGSGSQLYTSYVDLAFGTYDILVMNRSTDGGVLRLEGVSSVKRIKVSNDGISGTGSWEWVPGTPLYNGSIQTADEFVFVMLGTNDKGDITRPPNNEVKTYNFVKQIVSHLKTRTKNVIVMAANAVTNSEFALNYTQADTAVQMKKLAAEQATGFVDHYKATLPLKLQGESFLADGLHPNDMGYKEMFKNIITILDL